MHENHRSNCTAVMVVCMKRSDVGSGVIVKKVDNNRNYVLVYKLESLFEMVVNEYAPAHKRTHRQQ